MTTHGEGLFRYLFSGDYHKRGVENNYYLEHFAYKDNCLDTYWGMCHTKDLDKCDDMALLLNEVLNASEE